MATSPMLTPPPSSGGPQDEQQQQPSGAGASPAPAAEPSEESRTGVNDVITAVSALRRIAKAFPETAQFITQINAILPKVQQAMMKRVQPGEPMAPPQ